jgi:hypothetical protein
MSQGLDANGGLYLPGDERDPRRKLLGDFAQKYCFVAFSRRQNWIVNIERREALIDHPAKRLDTSPAQAHAAERLGTGVASGK